MKDLSIIIVTYNSQDFIGKCLDSVFGNIQGLDFEVIIVDNNSQDKNLNLVRENFGDKINLKIIENKENIGFARGINQGIRLSEGKRILFLNPDTLVPVGSIKKLTNFLDKRSNIGIVGCRTEDRAGRIKPSFGHFPRTSREIFWALGCRKIFGHTVYPHFWNKNKFFNNREADWVSGACFLVKREVIDKVGLLDEKFFMYFEDIDFCRRAGEVGYKTFYLGEVMINHELGKAEKRRGSWEIKSLLVYFEKHLPGQFFILKILITIKKFLLFLGLLFYENTSSK